MPGEYCLKNSFAKLIEKAIKLLRCFGFLYKAVHKIGLFSVFVFLIFFSFKFRKDLDLVLKFGKIPLNRLFSNTVLEIFDIFFFVQEFFTIVYQKWAKFNMLACFQR